MTALLFGKKITNRFMSASRTKKILALSVVFMFSAGYVSSKYEEMKTDRMISRISMDIETGNAEKAMEAMHAVEESIREKDARFAELLVRIQLALTKKECMADGTRQFEELLASNRDEKISALGRRCSGFVPELARKIQLHQENLRTQWEETKRRNSLAIKKGETLAILTIKDFERSNFLAAHPLAEKSKWALKSGGSNFSYSFADPENIGQSIGIELNSNPLFITNMSISFTGMSINNPARLSPTKEIFLKSLIDSTYPDINFEEFIAHIRSLQNNRYPGGSSTMPRSSLGDNSIAAGVVASSLVISIRR